MQELALLQMFARELTRGDRDLALLCGADLRSHTDPSTFYPFNLNTPQHCRNTQGHLEIPCTYCKQLHTFSMGLDWNLIQ